MDFHMKIFYSFLNFKGILLFPQHKLISHSWDQRINEKLAKKLNKQQNNFAIQWKEQKTFI